MAVGTPESEAPQGCATDRAPAWISAIFRPPNAIYIAFDGFTFEKKLVMH
jgi:hypothetical protein